MGEDKKIKLFKIASEINIGKDTIVDFLQGKGFDIQNKATSVLTPEMVELVYEKFKREKRAAEIQRDKLLKHKKVKKPLTSDIDEINKEDEKSLEPKGHDIEEQLISEKELLKQEKESIALIDEKAATTEGKKAQLKTVGADDIKDELKVPVKEFEKDKIIIDLDKFDGKYRSKQKINKTEKEIEEKVDNKLKGQEKTTIKETEVSDKEIATKKENKIKEEKYAKNQIIEDKVKTKATAELEEQIVEKTEIPEQKVETKVQIIETESSELESITQKKERKRKKRKKILKVEIDEDQQLKLKGLTVVGKIDIEDEKFAKKPKVEKKVIDIEDEELTLTKKGKSKKKRAERRKKKKISVRELISEEEVDKALKETLAGIGETHKTLRAKLKQKKKSEREEKELKQQEELEQRSKILELTEFVTTADLANLLKVNPNEIILKCMGLGLMVTLNQRLDKDTITLIADDFGYQVQFIDEKTIQVLEAEEIEDPPELLKPRSPIVTVMGHVDHGKTSLLDYIRKTQVVAGEAGGITQHIGAYRVIFDQDKSITFLDTPGHEAFTAMRARGAQVTDIVVLVVAADDAVMPQTIEAISHAQAANVPIIVAINKIDKTDANPERIKQQLSEHNILVEDWGGKYQSVEISAKKGINIDLLLEKILLEAELLELKANPDRPAKGTIVEANMSKGLGPIATLIVQKGILKIGDSFVTGLSYGKVRMMFDERDNKLEIAGPSMPVVVTGFDRLPEAGDIFMVVDSESHARQIANERLRLKREQEFRQGYKITLDDLSREISLGEIKELNLIIKGDVGGSVEALSDSLSKQSNDEVRVVIVHQGVGAISESDIMLAVASKAVIIGFQVSPTANARKLAEKEKVDIRLYNIIYDAINDVRLAVEGLLSPEIVEEITATVEVRKVFKVSKLGYIAGCYVKEGKINRNDRVKVLRDGITVYNGTIHSLKREKDDAKEVETNYECGIMLENFNDIEVGDIIQAYKINEIKRTL